MHKPMSVVKNPLWVVDFWFSFTDQATLWVISCSLNLVTNKFVSLKDCQKFMTFLLPMAERGINIPGMILPDLLHAPLFHLQEGTLSLFPWLMVH
jgi:hypothetical protein